MAFFGQRHNNVSCCHKRLFIGKRNILACLNCFYCRPDSYHAHNRRHQNLYLRYDRYFNQSFHPTDHTYIQIPDSLFQLPGFLFRPYSHKFRRKLSYLLLQKLYITSCSHSQDFNILIFSHNLQRLCPDRTCRT